MKTTDISYQKLHEFRDARFDEDEISHYSLLLEIGNKDFEFCVIDTRDNKCVLVEEYLLHNVKTVNNRLLLLRSLFQYHNILAARFWKNIKISIKTHKYTLVPLDIFTEDKCFDYLSLNCDVASHETVIHFIHKDIGVVNIFTVDTVLYEWLRDFYKERELTIIQQGSSFIEGVLEYGKQKSILGTALYCLMDRNILHLCVCDSQRNLWYYNQFYIKTYEDFLKYVLLIFSELKMNKDSTYTISWGDIDYKKITEMMHQHITNVEMGSHLNFLSFSYEFDEMLDHKYFDLFSIHKISNTFI